MIRQYGLDMQDNHSLHWAQRETQLLLQVNVRKLAVSCAEEKSGTGRSYSILLGKLSAYLKFCFWVFNKTKQQQLPLAYT